MGTAEQRETSDRISGVHKRYYDVTYLGIMVSQVTQVGSFSTRNEVYCARFASTIPCRNYIFKLICNVGGALKKKMSKLKRVRLVLIIRIKESVHAKKKGDNPV